MKTKFKWVGKNGVKCFSNKVMKKGAIVSLDEHFAAKAMNLPQHFEPVDVIEDAVIIEEPEVIEEPEAAEEVAKKEPKKAKKTKLFV